MELVHMKEHKTLNKTQKKERSSEYVDDEEADYIIGYPVKHEKQR